MNIIIVAGARPNFIKIAPIIHEIQKHSDKINYSLVHTGQHYNNNLNDIFFQELNIPEPDINLDVQSGTQAEQTGLIMIKFEEYLKSNLAEIILVVGDVNSTLACSIVAKKMNRQLLHVEAGIRSFDIRMPEEINRMVTDSISDHFFTTSLEANKNLLAAGIDETKIHFVGNTMIDTLMSNLNKISAPVIFNKLIEKKYWLLTLHRPSNVDDPDELASILTEINKHTAKYPIVFPVHPRTEKTLTLLNKDLLENIILISPLGYLEFIYLIKHATGVITDSGGIQEETTVLNIPCLTLRKNTERPETVSIGTNELVPELNMLGSYMQQIAKGVWKQGSIPEFWDGKTSERIISKLLKLYQ